MTALLEPTEDQTLAGAAALRTFFPHNSAEYTANRIYRAMVASAPQEPDDDAELAGRLRSHATALYRPDHPTALLMWEAAARLQAKAPETVWHPHLDYAGEPMKPGEFRDRPEAPETDYSGIDDG